MARFDPPVPVLIGECSCPGTPHEDGDIVYLAPALSMAGGMAATAAINEGADDGIVMQEQLARVWLRHAIVSWTLTDEDGQPLPLDRAAEALPYGKGGRLVAEKADELYAQDVLAPFLEMAERARRSSPGSSSRSRTSSTRPSTPKPPRPSSTTTTDRAPRSG